MREDHARIMARLAASGMDPNMLITKNELAALAAVHSRGIDRLLAANDGPPSITLTPGRIAFSLRDVIAWLNERRSSKPLTLDNKSGQANQPAVPPLHGLRNRTSG
jgi:predicted DNA-binding transcriptional regulator AlpA